jgi:hypothetical protein
LNLQFHHRFFFSVSSSVFCCHHQIDIVFMSSSFWVLLFPRPLLPSYLLRGFIQVHHACLGFSLFIPYSVIFLKNFRALGLSSELVTSWGRAVMFASNSIHEPF